MSTRRKWFFITTTIILALFATSCKQPTDSVPVKSVYWEADGNGFIQFMTNDDNDLDSAFLTSYDSSYQASMTTVSANVKKNSGNPDCGYGIVFCKSDSNNFYRILIDVSGYYAIRKKVAGTYTTIVNWTFTSNLVAGFGQLNNIKVTQSSANNFDVYFNNNMTTSFNGLDFTGGKAGFYAAVGSADDEDFPDTAVDVRFQLLSPVAIP